MNVLIAKGQLTAWAIKNGGKRFPSIGPTWTAQDSGTLADFSTWWNQQGYLPILPTLPAPALSEVHALALNLWAAGQAGQSIPGLPGGIFPFPPAPSGWPVTLPWPLIGSSKPEGWPVGWPWPAEPPPQVPASLPWPLPIPQIPGLPTSLPPPFGDQPVAEKKTSYLPWVLGALAVGAVMLTAAQPRQSNPEPD